MTRPLTVGSLFSGIGGFDLGLERAGMRTLWFCEQDKFCQRVLGKHWPGVPVYDDVCALVADPQGLGYQGVSNHGGSEPGSNQGGPSNGLGRGGQDDDLVPVPVPYVDILCGGFPCQDISLAGKGAGIEGARSGLWSEYARLIGELRPRYVIVENVSALLGRGLDRVLGDLSALGFDAEWDCIPASAVGAPHQRDRVWLVAYPNGGRLSQSGVCSQQQGRTKALGASTGPDSAPMQRLALVGCQPDGNRASTEALADSAERGDWWSVEPDVGRVAHGIPRRVDRLRSLGNALVPQIAEWIGSGIVAYEESLDGVGVGC